MGRNPQCSPATLPSQLARRQAGLIPICRTLRLGHISSVGVHPFESVPQPKQTSPGAQFGHGGGTGTRPWPKTPYENLPRLSQWLAQSMPSSPTGTSALLGLLGGSQASKRESSCLVFDQMSPHVRANAVMNERLPRCPSPLPFQPMAQLYMYQAQAGVDPACQTLRRCKRLVAWPLFD
jgi:hypothetical protein